MRAKRIDDNQNEIVKQLRKIPRVSVAITSSLGQGFPDFIIGYQFENYMIELKDENKPPSARKLTPDEVKFRDNWFGQYSVCKNLDEILEVLGI